MFLYIFSETTFLLISLSFVEWTSVKHYSRTAYLAVNAGNKTHFFTEFLEKVKKKNQISENSWGSVSYIAVKNGHITQNKKHACPQETKRNMELSINCLRNPLGKVTFEKDAWGWLWTMWLCRCRGLQELGILVLKDQRWEPWFVQVPNLESP
jgi:hypothetical protein